MREQRSNLRTLTLCALLVAMSIVFSRVLTISTGFVRFNLGGLPVVLAGVLLGPGAGFAAGAVADILGGLLAGYAINPLITLGAAVVGLVPGLVWRYAARIGLEDQNLRLGAGILLGHLLGSMILNSLALHIFYNYAWSVLAVRVPNYLVLSAVEFVLVRILLENRMFRTLARANS
jgi:ECF transporter S component (folate family)